MPYLRVRTAHSFAGSVAICISALNRSSGAAYIQFYSYFTSRRHDRPFVYYTVNILILSSLSLSRMTRRMSLSCSPWCKLTISSIPNRTHATGFRFITTFHTVLVVHVAYWYLVVEYGNPLSALRIVW